MRLKIENLGPVKEADIDLSKDLIVFCGENNSGKTYVSYAINGLFDRNNFNIDIWQEILEKELLLPEHGIVTIDMRPLLEKILAIICSRKVALLGFSESIINYSPDFIKNTSIACNTNNWLGFIDKFDREFYLNTGVIEVKAESISKIQIKINNNEDFSKNKTQIKKNLSIFLKIYHNLIALKQYFIPAERNGIKQFGADVIANRATDVKLGGVEKYPFVIKQGLLIEGNLKDIRQSTSEYAPLADELEKRLLNGQLQISQYGETLFKPKGSRQNIGNALSSSSVKALSSLVIYLRHIARKGDLLIIDEPELNLHPRNQRIVARILAKMVNLGIRVLVSTHSDYIIKELNHCIMLHNDSKTAQKLQKKYGYQSTELLDHKRVGVYHFAGGKANEVTVSQIGFDVESIDDEIRQQGKEGRTIFETLYDNGNDEN